MHDNILTKFSEVSSVTTSCCNKQLTEAQVIKIGELYICSSCKNWYFQNINENHVAKLDRERMVKDRLIIRKLDIFPVRVAAAMLDYVFALLGIVGLMIIDLIVNFRSIREAIDYYNINEVKVYIIGLALYQLISTVRYGCTVGMRMFDLRVINKDFSPVGYLVAFWRVILQNVVPVLLIWLLFSKRAIHIYPEFSFRMGLVLVIMLIPAFSKHLTWHDLFCQTYVVKNGNLKC